MKISKNVKLDEKGLWRIPAVLSFSAVLILPLAPSLMGSDRGTLLRETLAHLLAFGVCAAMLGLGLGIWIALRTRTWAAVLTCVLSVVVALLWWQRVFSPLVGGSSL